MKFAIVISKFNREINEGLLWGAKTLLSEKNVSESDIEVVDAPGAFEIPLIAKKLALSAHYDGVICLGSVIKGQTAHFEYISEAAAHGLMQASLETEIPLSFGILTVYEREQAESRSQKDAHNKGREAALACFETALLLQEI